jgi:hypothetical protein
MNQSPITTLPEFARLIEERKHIRAARAEAQRQANILAQLAQRVPKSGTGEPLGPLTNEATPTEEITAVLPLLEQQLLTIQQIETRIREHYAAIQEIKRKARNLKLILICCGLAVFIVLVLVVLLYVTHVFQIIILG